jgi:hypothetical protein
MNTQAATINPYMSISNVGVGRYFAFEDQEIGICGGDTRVERVTNNDAAIQCHI